MSNSTATPGGARLLDIQLELLSPTTVAGTFYGIAFTLFCLYVHALVTQLRDDGKKRRARFMLAYSAILMLCGLYDLVSNAWVAQDAYVKHGNYPGGPYLYVETTFGTPVITVGLAGQVVVDILTSAIQIWRVYVVWSATRHAKLVIVLPSLCFLAWTALKLRTVILQTTLPIRKFVQLERKTLPAGDTLQGVTTILCTVLISLFLIFKHWQQRRLIGKAQGSAGYMKIVAMLIESYVLESIWVLLVAVLPTLGVVAFFAETMTYIEIIAYLLVQYRVASGNSYEPQREQGRMSSLHWNHSTHVTTQFGSASDSEVTSGRLDVSVKPETSQVVQVPDMA